MGAVVGATDPRHLARIRELLPAAIFLIPGVGAQGGRASDLGSALTGVLALVSWELDLWGQLRYGTEAAAADFSAAQGDRVFARQSLAATTARAWFMVTQTLAERQVASRVVGSAEHLLQLASDRFRVGAGSDYDVALAQSGLGTLSSSVSTIISAPSAIARR